MKLIFLFISFFVFTQLFSQDLIPYRNQKLWGYANQNGKIIIDLQYDKALPFQKNGLAEVFKNGECFLINSLNQIKSQTGYKQKIEPNSEILTKDQILLNELLKKDELKKEAELIKAEYILKTKSGDFVSSGDLTSIGTGLYIADIIDSTKRNKFGLIDENNKILVPFEYDYISTTISEGLIVVSKDSKYGFCDLKGNEVILCKYALANPFQNGLARVYLSRNDYSINSTGYINKMGIEFFKSDPVYQITQKDGKEIVTDQYYNPVILEDDNYDEIKLIEGKYIITTRLNSGKLYTTDGKIILKGNNIVTSVPNCILVTEDRITKLYNYKQNKTIVDSIDHIASKISDPQTLKLFGYTYVNKIGRFGLFTETGKNLIPPKYTLIQFTGAYFILHSTLHRLNISEICDTNYQFNRTASGDNISYLSKNLFSVGNKYGHEIYDARTKKLSAYSIKLFPGAYSFTAGVFQNEAKQQGYINPITEEILAPAYLSSSALKMFDENFNPVDLILFYKKGGKTDIYNSQTGKIILKDCNGTAEIQGRYLPVKFGFKYMFYDCYGNKAFETEYENLKSVKSEGYSAAQLNGKWGIIDRENKPILDFKYDDISNMIDNLVIFGVADSLGILNVNDSILIPAQYQSIEYISTEKTDSTEAEYFFVAEKNNKKGIINHRNNIISPFELDGEADFSFNENVFVISKNKKPALFNKLGKIVLTGNFEEIRPFDGTDFDGNELVLVSKGKKYGLYHLNGKMILDCSYDKIDPFSEFYDSKERMYFTIEKNKKQGLICNTGELILPAIYDDIKVSYGDDISFMRLKLAGKYGLYANFRKKLSDCKYNNIDFDEETIYRYIFIVNANGKYGLLDSTGKEIAQTEYDKISLFENDRDEILFEVVRNGQLGLVNRDGKTIIPPIFNKIEPIDDIDNLGFYVYKEKYFGVINQEGKHILEALYLDKDYGDGDKYMLTFFDKNKVKWALTPTFELVKFEE